MLPSGSWVASTAYRRRPRNDRSSSVSSPTRVETLAAVSDISRCSGGRKTPSFWRMPEERVLTLRELNRALLARQLLLERRKLGVQQAVERICAIQAQWPQSPYIGLWTRLTGFRKEQLTRALEQQRVVKTQLFRITLHITSARDYPSFFAVWGPAARDRTPGVAKQKLEELTRRVRAAALERPITQEEVEQLAAEEMGGFR